MSWTRPDWTLASFAELVRLMRTTQSSFFRERQSLSEHDRALHFRGTLDLEHQVDRALAQIEEQLRAIDPSADPPATSP
jgi:hypothetical protein